MSKRAKFVGLTVKGFGQALNFYRNKLGFEARMKQPVGLGRWLSATFREMGGNLVLRGTHIAAAYTSRYLLNVAY